MGRHWEKVLEHRKDLTSKDVDQLLKPVTPNHPTGDFLLYTDTYDQIRDARFYEDKNIPRGVWVRPLKEADWNTVEQLCIHALTKQTKDLQIAAWLLEAWFHKYQIWGLLHGLRLERKLINLFWDNVHPTSKDDPEYRLAPFEWLNQKFVSTLTETILTLPKFDGNDIFTYGDYRKISIMSNNLKMNESRTNDNDNKINQLKTLAEHFKSAQHQTSSEFYRYLLADLDSCIEEILAIEDFISFKYKNYPGSLNNLRSQIQNIQHTIFLLNQDNEKKIPKEPLNDHKELTKPHQVHTDHHHIKNQKEQKMLSKQKITPNDRQRAYDQLRAIADQLAKIEPHSPTPYMIRKAVDWGEMSLAEVINELSQEGGDILKILRLLGINYNPQNK